MTGDYASNTAIARRPRLDLGTVIEALHNSGINGEVSWFYDAVWRVTLRDPNDGIDAEATVGSAEKAAEWLRDNAIRLYPDSEFANRFGRLQ
jgi:hypothetical protein